MQLQKIFNPRFFAVSALAGLAVTISACATPEAATTTPPSAATPAPVAAAPAPAPAAAPAPARAAATAPATAGDIVDIAVGAPQFSTLVAAVQAAGLVDTLKGAGPFTVFAPTNDAFAKLPAGTVANLLKPENKAQLVAILTYHVVPGKVMAADVTGAQATPATVQGGTLAVDGRSGVKVNGATVIAADIAAKNGVIHGIDTVLMPPAR